MDEEASATGEGAWPGGCRRPPVGPQARETKLMESAVRGPHRRRRVAILAGLALGGVLAAVGFMVTDSGPTTTFVRVPPPAGISTIAVPTPPQESKT